MSRILVVGATRGLGASLVKQYASVPSNAVYGTSRSGKSPSGFPEDVKWLHGVDLMKQTVGDDIVQHLSGQAPLSTVIITAGYFATEDFGTEKGPSWDDELRMYTTSSVAPVFIVHRLVHAGLLGRGSKVVLVSSESGSIGLRHESEGGGNYAHHASKAALNMAGKLLSLDVRDKEIIVSLVHPGFMRTEMTRNVGFDQFWDQGGAITPDESASSLAKWIEQLDISKTGQLWAPRGPGDIGTANATIGRNLPTPLQLPW